MKSETAKPVAEYLIVTLLETDSSKNAGVFVLPQSWYDWMQSEALI